MRVRINLPSLAHNLGAFQEILKKIGQEKASISLFHEGTSIEDIDQGVFGSCYFLAVLAGLVNNQEVMRHVSIVDWIVYIY